MDQSPFGDPIPGAWQGRIPEGALTLMLCEW